MTRNCVTLCCSLISLLIFTAPTFAQGTAPEVFGTPPPEGHTILEVATTSAFRGVNRSLEPGVPRTATIELPLPVFASGPTAEPSQCLWAVSCTCLQAEGDELLTSPVMMFDISYTLDGGNLDVELLAPQPPWYTIVQCDVIFSISAVAIRTQPASPVESTSFGEIKAMFRDE